MSKQIICLKFTDTEMEEIEKATTEHNHMRTFMVTFKEKVPKEWMKSAILVAARSELEQKQTRLELNHKENL